MARPPGKPTGTPKTGGRRRGSIDREQRKVLTDKMAADLVWAYQKAGGRELLLKIALENPIAFLQQGLSRLLPQPIKEEPDVLIQQQFNNVDSMTELDAARRVAFMLAKAAHDLDDAKGTELAPYTYTPERPYDRDCNPQEACHVDPDPARDAWAQSLASTPEEQLVQNTKECTIENYPGSAAERGVTRPARMRKRDLL